MKSKMTILAALLGLAILAVPVTASAHPMHPWRGAMAAHHSQMMGPRGRFNFFHSHPFFAQRRGSFHGGYAYGNRFNGPRRYGYGNGGWGQRFGYMNQEPDGDDYGYQPQYPFAGYGNEDGDGDDGGYAGYGMPMGAYGYGNPYYGNNFGTLGAILPMLGGYIH